MKNINKLKDNYKKFLNENFSKKTKRKLNERNMYFDINKLYDITEKDDIKKLLVDYELSYDILKKWIEEVYVSKEESYINFDIDYKEGINNNLKERINKFFHEVIKDYLPYSFHYYEDMPYENDDWY